MKAIVCLGKYAKNPYCFEKLGILVYSMEELSYCLKENAFLLGTEIMEDALLRFIDVECDVPQLARELYSLVHQKGSLSAFVTIILEYVGFYDKETIRAVESTIKSGSGLSDFEKRKLQTDHLAGKRRYPSAMEEYDSLIRDLKKVEKQEQIASLLAGTLHNRGVVLTSLYMYGEAAVCFQEAYEISNDGEELLSFLSAKRMELPEKDYISMIAQKPEYYEASLQVERRIEEMEKAWVNTSAYAGLQNMKEWNVQGRSHKYYEEGDQLVEILKEEYRSGIWTGTE